MSIELKYLLGIAALFYINHLWILGAHRAMHVEFKDDDYPQHGVIEQSKNIFWYITYFSVTRFGWFWAKPISTCPICMASYHSTYIYWGVALLIGVQPWMLPLYLVYMVCLAGFNWYRLEQLPK